ncbi:MAG: hypothetical protein AMXMBFR7_09410 [Planctomycetota bacterium]
MEGGDEPVKGFSELAVERGYCTPQQIVEAMRERNRLADQGQRKEVPEILHEKGVLTKEQVRALERAVRGATVIAGFEILEKVGQGGMGAVFRARQIAMDRLVALKILPPKLAKDPSFKERFLREARLSAKLNHLNIISGIECGESGGYMYFAMEFVEGKSVQRMLEKKGGPLALDEATRIIRQIAEALQYANRHGLVHRDLKPDNIMVTTQGVAKLCDLGLAKLDQRRQSDDASLTQTGVAVGTPHYISPEQARGESKVDIRSDIYSLGATFFHMIVGKVPFTGETAQAIMMKHLMEEAPSVCDHNPEVSEAMGFVVAKMMAKDAADRYECPEDLIADLDALMREEPVAALDFKGKTSCATPKRGGRKRVVTSSGARAGGGGVGRRASSEFLSPVSADRTRSPSLNAPRRESVPTGAFLGGGVLLIGVLILMMSGGGGSNPRPSSRPAPNTAYDPIKPPQPVRAPVVAEAAKTVATGASPDAVDPEADPIAAALGMPGEPREPDDTAVPAPADPAAPTPARPKPVDRASIDRAYNAFAEAALQEAMGLELSAALEKARALAQQEAYLPAAEPIAAELTDWSEGAAFERSALEALAAGKVPVRIVASEGQAKALNNMTLPVSRLLPGGGVEVLMDKAGMPVPAAGLDPLSVVDGSKLSGPPAGRVQYLLARGALDQARADLPLIPVDRRDRYARRIQRAEPLVAARKTVETAQAPEPAAPTPTPARPLPVVAQKPIPQGTTFDDVSRDGGFGAALRNNDRGSQWWGTGVASGDLNGDGRMDLVMGYERSDEGSSYVRALLNLPDGLREITQDLGLGSFHSRTVHMADLDQDGHLDLAFNASDGVRVYRNGGPPNFRMQEVRGGRLPIENPEGSLVLDYNGDGRPDLLVAGNWLSLFAAGDPPQDVSDRVNLGRRGFGTGNGAFLTAIDLNNDSFTDFLYCLDAPGVVGLNEGGQRFRLMTDSGLSFADDGDLKPGLAAGDVNNDGWADVVVPQANGVRLFLNNGRGQFSDATAASGDLASKSGPHRTVALADFDLDGDLDLLASPQESGVDIFLNDGQGRFANASAQMGETFGRSYGISYLSTADLNDDGVPDVLANRRTRSGARLWLNRRAPLPEALPLRVRFVTAGMPTPVGARVVIKDAWQRTQTRWVSGGDGRGGQEGGELLFGVPQGTIEVIVVYPGGSTVKGQAKADAPGGSIVYVSPRGIESRKPAPAVSVATVQPVRPAVPDPQGVAPPAVPAAAAAEKTDLTKLFGVKPNMRPDGSADFIWISNEQSRQAFHHAWAIDDPAGRASGNLLLPRPQNGALIGFRGFNNEIWNGQRNNTIVLTTRNAKPTRFRLEVAYAVGPGSTNSFSAGIGMWDGDTKVLVFGPHESREGHLAVWGQEPDTNASFSRRYLSTINKKEGQLAVEADGNNNKFYYRDLNVKGDEGWVQIESRTHRGDLSPAILPMTWQDGRIEMYLYAVRLIVRADDPLLNAAGK